MKKLSKDALFLLGLKLDLQSIKIFSLSNKIFYEKVTKDEYFWLTKTKHDYPFLDELNLKNSEKEEKEKEDKEEKEKEKDWKTFYVEMNYYINELKKIKIPYIAVKGYNPKELYLKYDSNNEEQIYNYAMYVAARGGDMNMVKYLLEIGAKAIDWGIVEAAKGGHIDIVKLMLDRGSKNFDSTMVFATYFDHLNIVELMIAKGATNFEWAKNVAKTQNRTEILHYLKNFN